MNTTKLNPRLFDLPGFKAGDAWLLKINAKEGNKGITLFVDYPVSRKVAIAIEREGRFQEPTLFDSGQLAKFTARAAAAGFPLRRPVERGDTELSADLAQVCQANVPGDWCEC